MKYLIFFGGIIAYAAADISLKNNPSTRPLPAKYGAPPASASIQVAQENLRFSGQVVEITTGSEPRNAYLPPSAEAKQQSGQLRATQVNG